MFDNGLQNLINAHAGFGRHRNRIGSIQPDHFLNLTSGLFDIGAGQVDFVDHRNNFEIVIHGQVNIGQRLRFHALSRIDNQQCALTSL